MEALLISFVAVATAELGDKTQLVALCLASRFKRPVPIIAGIIVATLASHVMAGLAGQWMGSLLSGYVLHVLLALSFFGAAAWALIPDKLDENCDQVSATHRSVFITTCIAFFIAEIGDKTQLATAMLAAQFNSLTAVVMGTTLGMVAVNAPAVILSHAITGRIPMKLIRATSGVIFALLGFFEFSRIFQN